MTNEAPRLMRRSRIGIIVRTLPRAARARSRGGEEGTGGAWTSAAVLTGWPGWCPRLRRLLN